MKNETLLTRLNHHKIEAKAFETLAGMFEGVAIDKQLRDKEMEVLRSWLEENTDLLKNSTFSEASTLLKNILEKKSLGAEEREDILYICRQFSLLHHGHFDQVTSGLQRLQGIMVGIAADGVIELGEVTALKRWIETHPELAGRFPYSEINSLLTCALADGKIDEAEQAQLLGFMQAFGVDFGGTSNNTKGVTANALGICEIDPNIVFDGMSFCLTGRSKRSKRADIAERIEQLNGTVYGGVIKGLDYLVICEQGSASWVYSAYGRKVEEALQNRKEGNFVKIIHENDLWDAFTDNGYE